MPTGWPSITVTGMIPPTVELISASAARRKSSALSRPSYTGSPASPASPITDRRVTPASVPPAGVSHRPSTWADKLNPGPSVIDPDRSRRTTSWAQCS